MNNYAVIFDVDGVLVDSYHAHFESWRQMLREVGIDFSEQQFRATFGRRSQDILQQLLGDAATDQHIAALDERKESLYRSLIRADFPHIPGAVELIHALDAEGVAMGLGSSGPPENIALTVECLGCAERFGAVVTRRDVSRGKPDPQVFQVAADRLAVEPVRCAVVEDAPAGIEAANRAGMASIALTGTATRAELAAADLVVDQLADLDAEVIKGLIDGRALDGR